MKTIQIVRTLYPHWGAHSGLQQYLRHLDARRFRILEKVVPMDKPWRRVPILGKRMMRNYEAARRDVYQVSDFNAEMSLCARSLIRRIDLIHLLDAEHALRFLPAGLKWASAFHRRPRVVAMYHQPPAILKTLVCPAVVRRADTVLLVSPTQAPFFASFFPEERIRLIPLGVDTDYFRPLPRPRVDGPFRCLAIGVWLRDYEALIASARILRDRNAGRFEFHIVSTSRLDIPAGMENITIHRQISDAAMLGLYQTVHAFYMPLKDATSNNALLEAIACGLPVISSDLPAVRYYLGEQAAILVAGNSPQEFADALILLDRDRGRCEIMGAAARRRALEFSWPAVAVQYEKLYEEECR